MTLKEFKKVILEINEEFDDYIVFSESGWLVLTGDIYIDTVNKEVVID